jgi:hypothetical protein
MCVDHTILGWFETGNSSTTLVHVYTCCKDILCRKRRYIFESFVPCAYKKGSDQSLVAVSLYFTLTAIANVKL